MKRSSALLLTAALLLGAFAASAQSVPCFLGGFTDETNTAWVYRAGIQIDISYPQWVNDHEFARSAVITTSWAGLNRAAAATLRTTATSC